MLLQNVVHDSTYVAHNTTRDVWSHIVSANEYRTELWLFAIKELDIFTKLVQMTMVN